MPWIPSARFSRTWRDAHILVPLTLLFLLLFFFFFFAAAAAAAAGGGGGGGVVVGGPLFSILVPQASTNGGEQKLEAGLGRYNECISSRKMESQRHCKRDSGKQFAQALVTGLSNRETADYLLRVGLKDFAGVALSACLRGDVES